MLVEMAADVKNLCVEKEHLLLGTLQNQDGALAGNGIGRAQEPETTSIVPGGNGTAVDLFSKITDPIFPDPAIMRSWNWTQGVK